MTRNHWLGDSNLMGYIVVLLVEYVCVPLSGWEDSIKNNVLGSRYISVFFSLFLYRINSSLSQICVTDSSKTKNWGWGSF